MTNKDELQKEINDKVKPGIKPSDIKKLKRSKSTGDIPNPPPPPSNLLQDQLNQKQKDLETLRAELEKVKQELSETKQQLDDSLTARIAGVKVFGQEHLQRIKSEQELNETIDQASSELDKGDSEISQLRTQLNQLKISNASLTRELKLSRLNRNNSPTPSWPNSCETNWDYLPSVLYSLVAVFFTLWLTNHLKKPENQEKIW